MSSAANVEWVANVSAWPGPTTLSADGSRPGSWAGLMGVVGLGRGRSWCWAEKLIHSLTIKSGKL